MITSEPCACILTDSLKIISKKWNAFVFCQLLDHETMNFNELLDQLSDRCGKKITASVFSLILNELEDIILVSKRIIAEYIPIRTEYMLTPKGKELCIIYSLIREWALKWFNEEKKEDISKVSCPVFEILQEMQTKASVALKIADFIESN